MFNQWCTIQSDPGVFTQLIERLGIPNVQVEEIYSMEDDQLITKIKPEIYGFIFLFKWTKNLEDRQPLTMYDQDLYFARQIVNNACATQALMSVLLNANVQKSGPLGNFYEFTKFLPSEDRGLALSNSEDIRKIHNSFSRPQPFIFKKSKKSDKKADVFHFISYVPFKGCLYELDGLQPGPIMIGKYDQNKSWIDLAKEQIQNRILRYSEKQIHFNLLVVCQNLRKKKLTENTKLLSQKAGIFKKLKTLGEQVDDEFISQYPDAQVSQLGDSQTLHLKLNELAMNIEDNALFCQQELHKQQKRKEQNIRRKHNYVPLIIQMMKTLAKKDMLNGMIDKALEKKKEKSQNKQNA